MPPGAAVGDAVERPERGTVSPPCSPGSLPPPRRSPDPARGFFVRLPSRDETGCAAVGRAGLRWFFRTFDAHAWRVQIERLHLEGDPLHQLACFLVQLCFLSVTTRRGGRSS